MSDGVGKVVVDWCCIDGWDLTRVLRGRMEDARRVLDIDPERLRKNIPDLLDAVQRAKVVLERILTDFKVVE